MTREARRDEASSTPPPVSAVLPCSTTGPAALPGAAGVEKGGTGAVVVGVDVGGTGVRARAGSASASGGRSDLEQVVRQAWVRAGRPPVEVAAVGCAGIALLGPVLRADVGSTVARACGARRVLICSDLLTAYLGALGPEPGVVLAAGTGVVALGGDLGGTWRRADGWGLLLGDDGGGAWIGQQGMRAAYRALDGRPGGSSALLTAFREVHGDPAAAVVGLTGPVQPTPSPGVFGALTVSPGVLAAFAPAVIAAAAADPIAEVIVRNAGEHLADTMLAALPPGAPARGAVTGNLIRPDSALECAFRTALRTRRSGFQLVAAAGTPLDGAVALGRTDELPAGMAQVGALSDFTFRS